MNIDVIEALKNVLETKPWEVNIWWYEEKDQQFGSRQPVYILSVKNPRIEGDAIVGKGCAFTLDQVVGFRVVEKKQ